MPLEDELFKELGDKYDFVPKPIVGGMGEVYPAHHRLLGEMRAIKVIRAGSSREENLAARFLREARIAAGLDHPNLVRLYDFSVNNDGLAWMVLEWVDGLDLAELLGRVRRLPLDEALSIAQQTLSALEYLHSRKIVHRDVSSDNLMISKASDASARVKLIDLGIAKGIEPGLDLTATGQFVGKLRYAAPEVLDSAREPAKIDRRSDLYSFGVVFYELLTGVEPIEGETGRELAAGHLLRPPRPFEETDPEGRVSEELRRIAMKALQKRPEDRYQSAESFASELEHARRALGTELSSEQRETVGLALEDVVPPKPDPEAAAERQRLEQALSGSSSEGFARKTKPFRGSGSEAKEEAWFEGLRRSHAKRSSRRSSVASSVIQVLQDHPKTAVSAALGMLAVIVVIFSGVLAGKDKNDAAGELQPAAVGETASNADVERGSDAASSNPKQPGLPEARSDSPAATGAVADNAESLESKNSNAPPATGRASFSISLIANDAQLSGALFERLGQELPMVVSSSLAQARAAGRRGLAIELSGSAQAIALEAYETLLPSCEAVAVASVSSVPTGRLLYSTNVRRAGPRCGEAMALAGRALAEALEPKVRSLAAEAR